MLHREFDFKGHKVVITLDIHDVDDRWRWGYAIDDGPLVTPTDQSFATGDAALAEAIRHARERIDQM